VGEPRTRRARLSGTGPVPEPAAGWSALHYGIDPAAVPLLRAWLRVMWWLARPLVRVPPLVLTVAGVLLALDAVLLAARWPWVALALVLLSAVCDGLDGAVAMLSGRASRFGSVADKIADRIADCAFAAVLWRCGAPWWLALAAGAFSLAHEGIRVFAGGARPARITVAERPTRVICTVLACGSAGVSAAAWPPTVCAAVWTGLALLGLAQLVPS
jgi:CDP-diacylglycerol--glycerol-3-phosphate 3-phosphatidyltransferase